MLSAVSEEMSTDVFFLTNEPIWKFNKLTSEESQVLCTNKTLEARAP